ncbi:MAG: rhamnulokinase [Naasia sp.]|jgi:rhamnulokinase|uniref:rhamnulokinase n=1 Tax=Naasia sp. TaxID=2546198 RepID=UPI002638BBBA|nr:rhamnulokinase family protein [Naasia sp.]MCU1571417.1 rhamnulokinase [Naasia sp.]
MRSVAAVDLGATSGRVILGSIGSDELHLRHVARFPNVPVRTTDGLHWDVLSLYSAAMNGLGVASREEPELVGAAVDSWAVDYGLLRGATLLGNPFHYRDDRTARGVAAVHAVLPAPELFERNGLQHLPFNTVFQLAAEAQDGLLDIADRLLLIPDLVAYWATGRAAAEYTNATTTGLVRVGTAEWDGPLLTRLGLPAAVLPEIVPPGTELGQVTERMRQEFGIAHALGFSTVGSHDTASAVVGVPFGDPESVYISCGTWSLVGAELASPLVTETARTAGFTNEGGVDGRTRFLKNVMGLWLLSESARTWAKAGEQEDVDHLLRLAADAPVDVPTFDATDPRLLAPGDMPARIAMLLEEGGHRLPDSRGAFVRSILQSLADAYAGTVRDIERFTGRPVRTVHVVGGGAQNSLLCQLTADATGVPVVAGPVEATAIGNLLVQARTHGLVRGDLERLRSIVAFSFPPRTYTARAAHQRR